MLAWVLAHELGHLVMKHQEVRSPAVDLCEMRHQQAYLACAMLLNNFSKWLFHIIYQPSFLRLRQIQQLHEFQADDFAVKAMVQAGYDPAGAIENIRAHPEPSEEEIHESHLSSHLLVSLCISVLSRVGVADNWPKKQDRIDAVRRLIKKLQREEKAAKFWAVATQN